MSIKPSLAIIALIAISACSSISLGYRFVDDLALNRLDKYFDLNSSQKSATREQLQTALLWFEQQGLPEFLPVLDQLALDMRAPPSQERLEYYYQQFGQARTAAAYFMLPLAVDFLTSLSPEQGEHALSEIEQDEQERLEENSELSEAEQFEEYYDELLDSAEDWCGRFSEAQRQQLLELAQVWWEERQQSYDQEGEIDWRQRFADLILTSASKEQFYAVSEQWLHYWVDPQNPEQLERQQQRFARQQTRIMQFASLLTQEQREHASDELRSYIEAFRGLLE